MGAPWWWWWCGGGGSKGGGSGGGGGGGLFTFQGPLGAVWEGINGWGLEEEKEGWWLVYSMWGSRGGEGGGRVVEVGEVLLWCMTPSTKRPLKGRCVRLGQLTPIQSTGGVWRPL